jgi:hypothetical protein
MIFLLLGGARAAHLARHGAAMAHPEDPEQQKMRPRMNRQAHIHVYGNRNFSYATTW